MAQKRNLKQEDWPNFYDGAHLEYRYPTCIVNCKRRPHWSLIKRLSPTFNRIKPAILIAADMSSVMHEDDTSYPGFSDDVMMNTDVTSSLIPPNDLCELVPRYDVIFLDTTYVGMPLLRQCHENNVWLINLRILRYTPTLQGFSLESLELIRATEPSDRIIAPYRYSVPTANTQWANIISPRKMISVKNDDYVWSLMEE